MAFGYVQPSNIDYKYKHIIEAAWTRSHVVIQFLIDFASS